MKTISDTRPSPIVGQWYSSDARDLSAQVDGYINAAQLPKLSGDVIAIMAPHAGHRYSGPVAGFSFSALRGLTPEIVVVISPMHHPHREPILTTAHAAYETPLGSIPVDKETIERLEVKLQEKLGFGFTAVSNDTEHSLEIELPFLQRALEEPFSLLPIMLRDQSARVAKTLGELLASILAGRDAVLVASTDLSHFYPQHLAKILDTEVLNKVASLDPQGVLDVEEQGKGFAVVAAEVRKLAPK